MKPQDFFTEEQKTQIENSIFESEKQTSGEIRLHIDRKCKGNVLDEAVLIFKKLKMDSTELRNGVLLYLSIEDRKFAIIGDQGINTVVPTDFWDTIYKTIVQYFKQEQYAEGLSWAIMEAGKQLQQYFPISKDDINELSNEISYTDE